MSLFFCSYHTYPAFQKEKGVSQNHSSYGATFPLYADSIDNLGADWSVFVVGGFVTLGNLLGSLHIELDLRLELGIYDSSRRLFLSAIRLVCGRNSQYRRRKHAFETKMEGILSHLRSLKQRDSYSH